MHLRTTRTAPPRAPRQHTASPKLFLLALAITLLAVACGASDRTSTASSVADSAAPITGFESASDANAPMVEAMEYEDEAMADEGPESVSLDTAGNAAGDGSPTANPSSLLTTSGSTGSELAAQLPDLGRDIIFTASIEIAATDVTGASRQAIRSIEGRGGFLFAQDSSGSTSVMTFKVLPEQFQAALTDLGSVGTVRSQSISADDVTSVVVDLQSRITTSEASVDRLRALLENAAELQTIATLENQLLQRETTLEQLRGQLRTVRAQVDLATITLRVTELLNRPGLSLETVAYAGHDAGFGCFASPFFGTAEAGEPITVCYQLTNTGDTPLVDVQLDDPILGATIGTTLVVDGSITTIEPGETVMLAHEVELTEPVRLRTSATATGINADGNQIAERVEATAATLRFEVADSDGLPSFGEVLSDSWSALVTLIAVIALVAVAAAPFLAVALIIGFPLWRLVRRNRRLGPAPQTQPSPPPPPVSGRSDEDDETDAPSVEKAATTS